MSPLRYLWHELVVPSEMTRSRLLFGKAAPHPGETSIWHVWRMPGVRRQTRAPGACVSNYHTLSSGAQKVSTVALALDWHVCGVVSGSSLGDPLPSFASY